MLILKRLVIPAVAVLLATAMAPSRTADDPPQFSEWSAPVNLGSTVNGPLGEWFSSITKDGLSLYFTADGCVVPTSTCREGYGGWDIFVSQRDSLDDPWGPPRNLGPAINTPYDEGAPAVSHDGHRLYFSSTRPGGFGGNDIYVSRRQNKRDDFGWQLPKSLGGGVNTSANESGPDAFEEDGTGLITLYFDSNRSGGPGPTTDDPGHNGNDIYVSTLLTDETFGPAILVWELSSASADRQPTIRRDGLEIYFASNRTGTEGSLDLWVASRATTSDAWSEPSNLGPLLNGTKRDASPDLSFDGTKMYITADRPDSGGYFDLYVCTRNKLKGPM